MLGVDGPRPRLTMLERHDSTSCADDSYRIVGSCVKAVFIRCCGLQLLLQFSRAQVLHVSFVICSSMTEVTTLLKSRGIDLDHNRFLILQGEVEQIAMMKAKGTAPGDEGEWGLRSAE